MNTRYPLLASLVALSTLPAPGVRAEGSRPVALERFVPAPDDLGFVGLPGSRTPGPERFHLGLHTYVANDLLRARAAGGAELSPVSRRIGADLSVELGLGGRGALLMGLPLVIDQQGDALPDEDGPLAATAPGDVRLGGRYRLLGESAGARDHHRDGPGLSLSVLGLLPSGDDDAFAGEGATRVDAELLGDFQVLGAGVGASIGLRHRFRERDLLGVVLQDEMLFAAALKIPIPPLLPLVGVVEVRGASDFSGEVTTPVEGTLGLRATVGDVTLVGSVGAGLTGGIGAPGVRGHLGVWWAPSPSDTDGDGIPDDADACRFLPEDLDGFEDSDGCEDPDNDNDLIPDLDDRCPNEEALEDRDEDEDGCTDPLPR